MRPDGRLLLPAESRPRQYFKARIPEGFVLSSESSSDGRVVAARPMLQPHSQYALFARMLASVTGRPSLGSAPQARGLLLPLDVGAEGQATLRTEACTMIEEDPEMGRETLHCMALISKSVVRATWWVSARCRWPQ